MLHRLRNFLKPTLPLPADVTEAKRELEVLGQARPVLSGLVRLHVGLLQCLWHVPIADSSPSITPEHARAKLGGGVPLLRGETLRIDREAFLVRAQGVCELLRQESGQQAAGAVAEAFRKDRLEPQELSACILAGRAADLPAMWQTCGVDAGIAESVLRLALFPILVYVQEQLASLRQGISWTIGYCPVCGSWPLLGEFRGLEQVRFLRCGLCAAGWEFSRGICPFCGNDDHRQLGFLSVEGQEARRRVQTCESCRCHIRTLATLAPLSAPQLLVKDLEALDLTVMANQRGYAGRSR